MNYHWKISIYNKHSNELEEIILEDTHFDEILNKLEEKMGFYYRKENIEILICERMLIKRG
jgi:hypothetical protein